ncbi:MAG: hypothetical protein F6K58_24510 [Symploca sp. SIO2E9]|nr:hypothetical protein [Symploca sp. SIO2E9]
MSEKRCGEIIKQTRRHGDAETRRRGDTETRRIQIPRKISFTPPPQPSPAQDLGGKGGEIDIL